MQGEEKDMKTKFLATLSTLVLVLASLAGCGSTSNEIESTEIASVAETEIPTEAPHEHKYTETITTPATCENDGEAIYTCECGDTYTEAIKATGHSFTNYVSNNDATYTADGTEIAKCDNCDATDTRTAEGSMLTYTYTDMDATKYAKSSANVRSMPSTDGEKLGGLSANNEVKVTGQCNETGWYRIEYDGGVAYVSDSYLVDNKVETQTASTQSGGSSAQSTSEVCPYELYTVYDDGTTYYAYTPWGGQDTQDAETYAKTDATIKEISRLYIERLGGSGSIAISWEPVGTYNGVTIVKRYAQTY